MASILLLCKGYYLSILFGGISDNMEESNHDEEGDSQQVAQEHNFPLHCDSI